MSIDNFVIPKNNIRCEEDAPFKTKSKHITQILETILVITFNLYRFRPIIIFSNFLNRVHVVPRAKRDSDSWSRYAAIARLVSIGKSVRSSCFLLCLPSRLFRMSTSTIHFVPCASSCVFCFLIGHSCLELPVLLYFALVYSYYY